MTTWLVLVPVPCFFIGICLGVAIGVHEARALGRDVEQRRLRLVHSCTDHRYERPTLVYSSTRGAHTPGRAR